MDVLSRSVGTLRRPRGPLICLEASFNGASLDSWIVGGILGTIFCASTLSPNCACTNAGDENDDSEERSDDVSLELDEFELTD